MELLPLVGDVGERVIKPVVHALAPAVKPVVPVLAPAVKLVRLAQVTAKKDAPYVMEVEPKTVLRVQVQDTRLAPLAMGLDIWHVLNAVARVPFQYQKAVKYVTERDKFKKR